MQNRNTRSHTIEPKHKVHGFYMASRVSMEHWSHWMSCLTDLEYSYHCYSTEFDAIIWRSSTCACLCLFTMQMTVVVMAEQGPDLNLLTPQFVSCYEFLPESVKEWYSPSDDEYLQSVLKEQQHSQQCWRREQTIEKISDAMLAKALQHSETTNSEQQIIPSQAESLLALFSNKAQTIPAPPPPPSCPTTSSSLQCHFAPAKTDADIEEARRNGIPKRCWEILDTVWICGKSGLHTGSRLHQTQSLQR